jgi:hypothetical protein
MRRDKADRSVDQRRLADHTSILLMMTEVRLPEQSANRSLTHSYQKGKSPVDDADYSLSNKVVQVKLLAQVRVPIKDHVQRLLHT